jgi:hypothetical protein
VALPATSAVAKWRSCWEVRPPNALPTLRTTHATTQARLARARQPVWGAREGSVL